MKNKKEINLNEVLEVIAFKDAEEFRKCWCYASECVVWEEKGFIFLNDLKVCVIDKKDKEAKKIIKNIIKRVREGWSPE